MVALKMKRRPNLWRQKYGDEWGNERIRLQVARMMQLPRKANMGDITRIGGVIRYGKF